LRVTCECKTRSETRPCHQQLEAYKKKVQMEALVESMSELQQGNRVALPSASVPLAHWTSVVGLECGAECSVKQRLDRAFVALQIVNPDLGQKLKLDYPVALQNWVAQDKDFVREVHNILADLVYKAQEVTITAHFTARKTIKKNGIWPLNIEQKSLVSDNHQHPKN
jgi:hypothetical protein